MTATRRRLATIATAAVATIATGAGLALVPGTADAGVSASAASRAQADAGTWLARQINGRGVVYNSQFQFDDLSATVDVASYLRTTDRFAGTIARADAALAQGVDAYTTYEGTVYGGATAKLTAYVARSRQDATDFGGVDLEQRLEAAIATEAPLTGRLQDSAGPDYSNTIGQAFAVEALARLRSGRAADAIGYLVRQQCSTGAFRVYFSAKTAEQQRCVTGAEGSEPSIDATAFAVLALKAARTASNADTIDPVLSQARRYLVDHQFSSGAFTDGGGLGVNTNSTGLAGTALAALKACGPAADAARWVLGRQVKRDASGPLGTQVGAIAYDPAAFKAGQADGITTESRGQWRLASAQAASSLDYLLVSACRA